MKLPYLILLVWKQIVLKWSYEFMRIGKGYGACFCAQVEISGCWLYQIRYCKICIILHMPWFFTQDFWTLFYFLSMEPHLGAFRKKIYQKNPQNIKALILFRYQLSRSYLQSLFPAVAAPTRASLLFSHDHCKTVRQENRQKER